MNCVKCGKELTPEEEKFAWIDGLCRNCFRRTTSGFKVKEMSSPERAE